MKPAYYFFAILVFVFIFVGRGWDAELVADFTSQHDWDALGIRVLQFHNRPYLNAEAWYTMGGQISFFEPRASLSTLNKLLEHELCHHRHCTTKKCDFGIEECHNK